MAASAAPHVADSAFAQPPLGNGLVLDSGSGAHSSTPPDSVQRHIAEQSRLAFLGQIQCKD
jgi:hypothetical protein